MYNNATIIMVKFRESVICLKISLFFKSQCSNSLFWLHKHVNKYAYKSRYLQNVLEMVLRYIYMHYDKNTYMLRNCVLLS